LYVRQSQLEIDKTQREMHDILVEIKKDESSMSQADEALRILQNRFKAGLSNTTDLLTAQAQLSQQRLLLSQSVMNYDITAYYLDFLLAK
jgi:outer membrane protein